MNSPWFGPGHAKGREILDLRRLLGHRAALAPASSAMLNTGGLWSLLEDQMLLLTFNIFLQLMGKKNLGEKKRKKKKDVFIQRLTEILGWNKLSFGDTHLSH